MKQRIEIDRKAVGRRLRELRGKSKSQDDVAADWGLSRSAVGMFEQGRRFPRMETLLLIANYYRTSVDSIFFIPKK